MNIGKIQGITFINIADPKKKSCIKAMAPIVIEYIAQ